MQLNPRQKKNLSLSLTPLIDVVFLLLVFFMLASTFSRFSSLSLSAKTSQGNTTQISNFILVRVNKEGGVDVNGKEVATDHLVSAIDELAQQQDMKLIIKPLDGASVQHLVTVLEHAKRSKIPNPLVMH